MSRSYALALIFTTLTLIGGAFYGQYRYLTNRNDSLLGYTSTVNDRLIDQKKQEIKRLHASTQEFLLDPIYSRRTEVLTIFTEADGRLSEYFETLERFDDALSSGTPDIHYLAHAALSPVLDSAIQVFQRNHLHLGMSARDVRDLTDRFGNMRHPVTCSFSSPNFPSLAFQLERETITLELLADINDLLINVTSLSCYRGCGFDSYHPFLMNSYTDIKSGEIINTQIGVGTFNSYLGTEYSLIIVDGDTLTVCDDGLADFSFKTDTPGSYSKKIEMIYTNPLTGEIRKGESIYNYRVH